MRPKNRIFINFSSILLVFLFFIATACAGTPKPKKEETEKPKVSPIVSAEKIKGVQELRSAFFDNYNALMADESLGSARKTAGEFLNFFEATVKGSEEEGGLSNKVKELMCVSNSVSQRCELCIVFHVYNAYAAGSTPHEILDAAMVGVLFGGGPGMAEMVLTVKESIDAYRNTKFDTP